MWNDYHVETRENKGTERGNQGVGWDMSIPLKLILTLAFRLYTFPRRPHSVEFISIRSNDLVLVYCSVIRSFLEYAC